MEKKLETIYNILLDFYGPQNWWPGEGLEIAIGAILTQQTNWKNVEKALSELNKTNCMNLECLKRIPLKHLEELIKSSGYYRVKAKRIKNLVELLSKNSNPSREELLEVKGLGNETVDSILLYLFEKPFFVIDVYTFRILERLNLYNNRNYLELQRIFMHNLPENILLYKEFHALLVQHAKKCCLKNKPRCNECPLKNICSYSNTVNTEIL
jgi:endonuclease-3 related protein